MEIPLIKTVKTKLLIYQKAMVAKEGMIFDYIDLKYDLAELTFIVQLANFYCDKIPSMDRNKAEEIALLSTLVLLSLRAHFTIAEEPASEIELQKKLQFPVLTGDLLYSRLFSQIIDSGNSQYLTWYTHYLSDINGLMVEYLQKKETLVDFLNRQYSELLKLTVDIFLDNSCLTVEKSRYWQENALKLGCFWAGLTQNQQGQIPDDEIGEMYQALIQESKIKIHSLEQLGEYLA